MISQTGQSELEQELVKTRHLLSQLEEELQDEKEDKEKAQEEAEKLRIMLDDVTSAQVCLRVSHCFKLCFFFYSVTPFLLVVFMVKVLHCSLL